MINTHISTQTRWSLIFASFSAALMLDMSPLPEWADWLWPQWLLLTLIFWCIEAPSRVGLGTAWCIGLVSDVSSGALLGIEALANLLIAYLVILSYRRVRQYPIIQQTGFIFALVFAHQIFIAVLQRLASEATTDWRSAATILTTALLWPWFQYILYRIRTQSV